MKTTSAIGRSLHVLVLAFCGLSFYALLLVLLGLMAGLLLSTHAQAQALSGGAVWVPTGNLSTPRSDHTATLLPNSKVLVAGGSSGLDSSGKLVFLDSAELYDPATETWSATGHLSKPRTNHTAILLQNGNVLVMGGYVYGNSGMEASVELYDPTTGVWRLTGGFIDSALASGTATLLADGKVLVEGGSNFDNHAEIYDPVQGTWTSTGSLNAGRSGHTATRLPDGKVLVIGGLTGSYDPDIEFPPASRAELYDSATGTWSYLGAEITLGPQLATLLPSGKVLVAGGFSGLSCGEGCTVASGNSTELYDPGTKTWSYSGSMYPGIYGQLTLLTNGNVLTAGESFSAGVASSLAQEYVPNDGTWNLVKPPITPRRSHTATVLANGKVLVAGGCSNNNCTNKLTSAELYGDPASIDASFTGAWYDPTQSGHGLVLEVLPGNRLVAMWYAFNPAGDQQAWFGGVGDYSGNTATVAAIQTTGGRWIPNFDRNAIALNPWGTLTFTFTDHDHGRVDFNSTRGYGNGSMNLTRLTAVTAAQATGPAPTSIAIGSVGAVATDATGNVYFSSDPDAVFKLSPQGTLKRIAGTGVAGYSGDGGPATRAQLNFPLSYPELVNDPIDFSELVGGLAADAAGNIYIADAYNNRVRKIDANGIITTVAGTGSRTNSGDGGQATLAAILWPQGVAVDSGGTLFTTSAYGPLRKVTKDGIVSTLAYSNCGPGFLGPGLCGPEEIAVDAASNIFVADGYCRVREVKTDGSITTVAGDDHDPDSNGSAFTCGYSGDGGLATKAALEVPYSVAVDTSGNLYIADSYNNCIRKVDSAGIIHTIAGICVSFGTGAYAGDGGPATSAQLNRPHGVAVDTTGNVYIADTYNNRLRKVDTSGIITTIAGNGAAPAISTTTVVGPAFTGSWYDPAQSGHGLMIEMLPNNRMFATWFAFNVAGDQQAWFDGVGTYSGNSATIAAAELPTGGRWIPNFDPNAIVRNLWGSLTFTFYDCNHGRVDFNAAFGYGSGSMNLTRLTMPAGLTCP